MKLSRIDVEAKDSFSVCKDATVIEKNQYDLIIMGRESIDYTQWSRTWNAF